MNDPGESARRRVSGDLRLAPPGPPAPAVPLRQPDPPKPPKPPAEKPVRSSVYAMQPDQELLLWMRDELFHETRGRHGDLHEAYGALIRVVYDAWAQIRPAAIAEIHQVRAEGCARPRRG